MLLGHLRQYCLATRHCDRSAVVVSCSECEQASWIWPWMRAVIAISSVEAAASVVALVLLFLVCTKTDSDSKLEPALSILPEIVIAV